MRILSPDCESVLSVVVQEHLQPAGTGSDELSGVTRAPSFSKTDLDTVGVPGPLLGVRLHTVRRHPAGALIVEDFEGETRHHPLHAQPTRAGWVQSGRVDKDRVLAAVVHPHSVRLATQHDAVTNFTPNLLYTAAAAVSSAPVAVMSVKVHRAVAARVIAAPAVGVGVELAEAEASALR